MQLCVHPFSLSAPPLSTTPTLTYSISTSPFPYQRFRIIFSRLYKKYSYCVMVRLYWDSRNHLLSSDYSSLSSLCSSVSTPFPSLLNPLKEGLVSVRFIESAKTATHRSLQTHAQIHNIFPMKIIIIGLSYNFF